MLTLAGKAPRSGLERDIDVQPAAGARVERYRSPLFRPSFLRGADPATRADGIDVTLREIIVVW